MSEKNFVFLTSLVIIQRAVKPLPSGGGYKAHLTGSGLV